MNRIPFQTINWEGIEKIICPGAIGNATSQTCSFGNLRLRTIDYSAGYLADHWCQKGHIVHCLAGEFCSELESGETFVLKAGMSYVVSDNASSHRSHTTHGVRLLIIDGDFLQ